MGFSFPSIKVWKLSLMDWTFILLSVNIWMVCKISIKFLPRRSILTITIVTSLPDLDSGNLVENT